MPLAEWTKQHLDSFLAGIAPIEDAYQEESFSYLAINDGEQFVVVQGTLFLNIKRLANPFEYFESSNVRAGHFLLSELGISRADYLARIAEGKVLTPKGELPFLPNRDSKTYGAGYVPFHELGGAQRRVAMLSLHGGETGEFLLGKQPHLDWEVRAATTPFDGIHELQSVFQFGALSGTSRIDVTAVEVAAIDTGSTVEGQKAKLLVRAAIKAVPEKVSVGIRVIDQGRTIKRHRILGIEFDWSDVDGTRVGTCQFEVPKGAVVQAMATYNGQVQHYYYFGDPKTFLNPLRAAYEAGDPKLAILSDFLAKAQGGRVDARHHEAAIAGVFWMLGFAPMHIGALPKMNDAADILLFTPSGNIAVVECTVGMLKEDHKLPGLHERTEAVRRNLDSPSTKHIRILPVIVTSKSAAEIRPDLEQAEKLGVYVVSREGIDRLLDRTLFPPAADQFFVEAERVVQENLAKYKIA